jgi:ribose 5-phosphate isomerase B
VKIAIGSDHRGHEVRAHLEQVLGSQGHEVQIITAGQGASCDYPDVAYPVAQAVAGGQVERGVLICGSGIGMSMCANKVKGIRAALVHDEVGADMSRRHNNANVLCLSADMLGLRIIDRLVETWLATPFEGGRHARRVDKMDSIDKGCDPRRMAEDQPAKVAE